MNTDGQIIIPRSELASTRIEGIDGRDIFVAFNEPAFKYADKNKQEATVDAKLNARLITHFLPAVHLAQKMERRPRLFVVSGINMALLWNAKSDEQRKIMLANNSIKFDFLSQFFKTFLPETFSIVEPVVAQDILKIPEEKLEQLWTYMEKKHPSEIREVKFQLAKFSHPGQFPASSQEELTDEQKSMLVLIDISSAFKYAISHLFVFGDINFEGNYIHNPRGYVSLGNEHEIFFNMVRNFAHKILKDTGMFLFDRKIIALNNKKVVIQNKEKTPPPYNGFYQTVGSSKHRRIEAREVTFENDRTLDYYDSQDKLKDQMDYIYDHFMSREEYQAFWDGYRDRYFDLKARYKEAYEIVGEW